MGDLVLRESMMSCVDAVYTGQNNLFKYAADLNPTNPASRLAIISITAITNDVELIWIGGSNAWQFVKCRSNLTDTNFWSDIFTNTPPSDITNSFIHAGAVAATNLFYRIKPNDNYQDLPPFASGFDFRHDWRAPAHGFAPRTSVTSVRNVE